MAKITFFSLFQHKARHNIQSPEQLEWRLRSHFIGGCVAGYIFVTSIYSFGMYWEKVEMDFLNVIGLVGGCLFSWMSWHSSREDLRQFARFQLEEKGDADNIPEGR